MQTLSAFETHTWWSDREMEDYIGTESCVDFQQHTEEEEEEKEEVVALAAVDNSRRRRRSSEYYSDRRRREKKVYPPAISSPWVLKRYYSGDGRLIIREENVGGQDYFKVCRANGRLTLQLVPPRRDHEEVVAEDIIDDEECHDDDEEPHPHPDGNINNNVEYGGGTTTCDESAEGTGDRTAVERAVPVGKCYKSTVISRPCLFGMPVVQAIRTVHI